MSEIAQGDPNELARARATAFARRLVQHWQESLGGDLLGAYLIGSLAHSGFSRRYSDIDIALITEAGLSPQTLDRLRSEGVALSADWGPKVSIFWTDRGFALGRFPPLDRIDYLDHALPLAERESLRPVRPALQEVRDYLRGAPFTAWADRARSFAAAARLEAKDHKAYLRTLLYPGRFCYSFVTGLIGSNDDAVAFLRERPLAGIDIGLIARALRCREAAGDPDALFSARAVLPSQIDACTALVVG